MANLQNCNFENNGIFLGISINSGSNINDLTPQVVNGVTLPQGVYRRNISAQPGYIIDVSMLTIAGSESTGQQPLPENSTGIGTVDCWVSDLVTTQSVGVDPNAMGQGFIRKVWMRNTSEGLPDNEVEVTIQLFDTFVVSQNPPTNIVDITVDIDGDAQIYEPPFYITDIATDADSPLTVSFCMVGMPFQGSMGYSSLRHRFAVRADYMNQVQTWGRFSYNTYDEFNYLDPSDINYDNFSSGANIGLLDLETQSSAYNPDAPPYPGGNVQNEVNENRYPTIVPYSFFHDGVAPLPNLLESQFLVGSGYGQPTSSQYNHGCFDVQSGLNFGIVNQNKACITFENTNNTTGQSLNMYNTSLGLSGLPETLEYVVRLQYSNGYDPITETGGYDSVFIPSESFIYQTARRINAVNSIGYSYNVDLATTGGDTPFNVEGATFETFENNKTMKVTIPLQSAFAINQTGFPVQAGDRICYYFFVNYTIATAEEAEAYI